MSKNIPYNKIIFSEEQTKDIINQYLNGVSSVQLGKKYNVGHKVILRILHENNVDVDMCRLHRKYNLNEHYFDVIDTPNKAYILGFLYADGNNGLDKSTISICLQEEDKEILERMRIELDSEKPLVFLDKSNKHDLGYTYKNQYGLYMFSKHMCNMLCEKGVVPNKSLIATFPNFLSNKLLPHFIRGVYDGDGSVYRTIKNNKNHAVCVTITATELFCEELKRICKEQLNIEAKIYDASCHNGITKVFTLSGRRLSKTFLDWIYNDADLLLKRKYNRYIDYYYIDKPLTA